MGINISKGVERVDHDRLSALPDDVILAIVRLLDTGTVVRIGALARRWRRVPRLLSDQVIDVADLIPHASDRTVDDIMTTYTNATRWLLAPSEERSIKSLRLTFYLTDPYLRSIGNAVVESGGSAAEPLEFTIRADVDTKWVNKAQRAMFGRRFMSFLGACPVAFSWLTSLTLQNICFSDSDISDLLNNCSRLGLLSLSRCSSSSHAVLQIDAPTSSLLTLEICDSFYQRVELTSVPKLQRFFCDDVNSFAPSSRVRFGYVPCLHNINLSTLHLRYYDDLRQLFPAFGKLRVMYLSNLKTEKMLWTLFVLAATPLLKKLSLKLHQTCLLTLSRSETQVVGERPKFDHQNLSILEIKGYAGLIYDIDAVTYICLIVERAVCLKKIHLFEYCPFTSCNGVGCGCQVNEQLLSKVLLAARAPSSTEITIEKTLLSEL